MFNQLTLLAPGISLGRIVFEASFVHVEFVVDKVVLEQVSLRVLLSSLVSIVPQFAKQL
jgi:hypothetical protein